MALLMRLAVSAQVIALTAVFQARRADAQIPVVPPTIEDDVKAAYLYNFTKFVEWPALAFRSTSDPLVMCVAADAAFSRTLERTVAGEKVGGRTLRLISGAIENAARCHVLYIGRGEHQRAPRLLAAAGRAPVLTVGDGPRFLQQGGMIVFVLENDRVRFDVDRAAAERAGLRVSSKLLRVARRVHPVEGTGTLR